MEDVSTHLAFACAVFALATAIILLVGQPELGLACMYGAVSGAFLLVSAGAGGMRWWIYQRSRRP